MAWFIGKSIPRLEDGRLVVGQGRYTNDIPSANACWAHVVRSPQAHALIRAIRVEAARAASGVLAVLTAKDYAADGNRPLPHAANPPDAIDPTKPSFVPGPDLFVFENAQPVLADDRVRYVGEAVALVVAESLEQARDAAELVEVDYEPLAAVVSIADALADTAPRLWTGAPNNISLHAQVGDAQAAERAFGNAFLVVEGDFSNQRIVNCQMEPRAAIGLYEETDGLHTLIAGSQGVVRQRAALGAALDLPAAKVRVISPDVGGGFGPRTSLYPESVLVVWAARRLGRPVRWTSDRSEAFLADLQGRDMGITAGAAFDRHGKLLALRLAVDGNLGAHPVSFAPLANFIRLIPTVYDVPVVHARVRGILTNSTPTSPYRGAGRPEATFALERLLDLAAQRLGIDRIEIRRRNMIAKSQLPYTSVTGLTYDSGDFHGNMEKALVRADWDGFSQRRKASRRAGRLRGIGIANYVEAPVGAARERVVLTVTGNGIELVTGTQSSGQGHATVFAQVVAELLGVPLSSVKLVTGDSNVVEMGGGSHSARSMRLVGTLLVEGSAKLLARARTVAAGLFDVAEAEIGFADGLFTASTSNRAYTLFDLAARSARPLSVSVDIARRIPAHPTGCAVCELEVDPETGLVELQRYTSIDDVGAPINPLIVDGQVHGGIVQGIGQALYEALTIDATGQVVSASFMDYALARADRVPSFDVELANHPTAGNPLGIKGGGEGGITPAPAAVINALADALREFGIDHIEMPATPQRIWAAINAHAARPATARK